MTSAFTNNGVFMQISTSACFFFFTLTFTSLVDLDLVAKNRIFLNVTAGAYKLVNM